MALEIEKTHQLYIVKRNDGGGIIRLALFDDVIKKSKERREVEITGVSKADSANPNWQKGRMIWWSPGANKWYEATQDDDLAKAIYNKVLKYYDTLPDVPFGQEGTLLKVFVEEEGYRIVDGQFRRVG